MGQWAGCLAMLVGRSVEHACGASEGAVAAMVFVEGDESADGGDIVWWNGRWEMGKNMACRHETKGGIGVLCPEEDTYFFPYTLG